MRRVLWLVGAVFFASGLLHCVGDEPNSSADVGDGSSDAAGGDGCSGTDGTTSDDGGGSRTDSGSDAATNPPDKCVGFTDCPKDIQAADLQLWLRGGFDMDCVGGHIVRWKDQSGKGHDATPPTTNEGDAAVAAQCGVASINGIDVATFTAPAEVDAGKFTEHVDETLDTNLDFTTLTDYTFFVVHERASDDIGYLISRDDSPAPGGGHGLPCNHTTTENEGDFGFGYDELITATAIGITYTQGCSNGEWNFDSFAANEVLVDELVFDHTSGHVIFTNGLQAYAGDHGVDDTNEVAGGGHGVIGRGNDLYFESRYHGSIAEIIGYSRALTSPERNNIEAYLKRQWGVTF